MKKDTEAAQLPILIEEEGKDKANILDVIVLLQYTGKIGPFADLSEAEMIEKGFDFDNDNKININDHCYP